MNNPYPANPVPDMPKSEKHSFDAEHSRKIKIGKMPDQEFAKAYPEAWELINYFTRVKANIGHCHKGPAYRKSRQAAVTICSDPIFDIDKVKACIRWCCSNERQMDKFWGRIPVNNLSTVINVYNYFLDTYGHSKWLMDVAPPHGQPSRATLTQYDQQGQR